MVCLADRPVGVLAGLRRAVGGARRIAPWHADCDVVSAAVVGGVGAGVGVRHPRRASRHRRVVRLAGRPVGVLARPPHTI